MATVLIASPSNLFLHEEISNEDQKERLFVQDKDIIDSTDVLVSGRHLVRLSYIGEQLSERIVPNEVPAMRTESSYTRDWGISKEGNERIFETVLFPTPQYIQQSDGWYYLERATVRKENFKVFQANDIIRSFLPTAHATYGLFYSQAGDGYVNYSDWSGDWSAVRSQTTGTAASYTQHIAPFSEVIPAICSIEGETWVCNYHLISRGFIPFNTSVIPAGVAITSATLNLYTWVSGGVYDADNDGYDYLTVVQTSQASHTQLVTADYDNIGTIEGVDSGDRKDISSIATGAYLSFTLNAVGRGWIAKSGQASNCSNTSGISCFGLREGHDLEGVAPDVEQYTGVNFYASEQSGTSKDPYLSVTYNVPFAFWQFQDF